MSYAERRKQKLTGWWFGEVETRQGGLELRYRRRFQTKQEADGYEAYVKATGQEPAGLSADPAGTFKYWAVKFRERNPEWGRKDRSALQRLEWLLEQPFGMMDVKTITTSTFDDIVTRLRKTPTRAGGKLGNRTINRYMDAASVVLRFAHERGAVPGMPYVPRLENKGNDRTETLTFDMEDAVCRWIEENRDPRIAFVIRVFCETGFRKGELWKLRPEQIGNETITLYKDQTKTDASRVVTVPVEMATKLRAMIAAGALPKASHVYEMFKLAVKKCGGKSELTIHSLRHTRATRLIEAGNDSMIVADLLGHSSLQTTKRYTHPSVAARAEAAKKVHQMRGDSGPKGDVLPFARVEKSA